MSGFRSAEELFAAVRDLAGRLAASGQERAAAELRDGLACLNGLTDGWADFLAAIERVREERRQFAPGDQTALEAIRRHVRRAVHRR